MNESTLAVGRRAERLAEQHLASLGAKILERNYHVQYAEVDLIAEHEGELVAVEVKSRRVDDIAAPEEYIFASQLRRVVRGLETYAQDNDLLDMPFRIDVALVVIGWHGEVVRFEHLKGVYPL
jgi:putative endonuclease